MPIYEIMKKNIIIVTADRNNMQLLTKALSESGDFEITYAASSAKALEAVKTLTPSLVIIDEKLPDMAGLDFVRSLLFLNAMINTAVVSSLSPEAFHEASEGLGIMFRLSSKPKAQEIAEILAYLST